MKTTRLFSLSTKRPNTAISPTRVRVPDSFVELYDKLPHLENVDPLTPHEFSYDRIKDEEYFDSMMSRCNTLPLHEAFEPILAKMFDAERAILWENRSDSHDFRSSFLKKEVGFSNTIISHIVSKRQTMILDSLKEHQLVQQFATKPESPQLFFPLSLNNGILIAIVQISRKQNGATFGSSDEQKAKFISRKFSIYGAASFAQPRTISYAAELAHYGNLKTTVDNISSSLKNSFNCKTVDFWFFNEKLNLFSRYERGSGFVNVYRCNSGIIGVVLRTKNNVNEQMCKNHSNYLPTVDGDGEDPILICCCDFDGRSWACALRGPRQGFSHIYSGEDEKHLTTLMPFISRSLAFSAHLSQPPPTPTDKIEDKIATTLDSAASFSSSLDVEKLVQIIEARFKTIIKCEKVRVLIVGQNKREFIFGNSNWSITKGISGTTLSSKKPFTCKQPQELRKYCKEIDIGDENEEEEIQINSFLSYPVIYYDKGGEREQEFGIVKKEVVGILNFINKNDGSVFDENDIEKIDEISHFCCAAIQNAVIYQSAVNISNHLRIFMSTSKQILQLSSAKKALDEILHKAREILSASRVTIFLKNDTDDSLYEFLSVGKKEKGESLNTKRSSSSKSSTTTKESIATRETFTNESFTNENLTNESFANEAIMLKQTVFNQGETTFICTTPLIDHELKPLGAMEIGIESTQGTREEVNLIESFAAIAAISLEKLRIQKLAEIGKERNILKKIISEEDTESFKTPDNFVIPFDELLPLNFDISKYDDSSLFKIVFAAFDKYNLKTEYQITNQKLFLFLHNISKSYQAEGSHSWRHAIDTLQFVIYIIKTISLDKKMNKHEIMSLFIAAICHDVGHKDFQQMKQNERTEATYDILYHKQSIEEMKHIEIAINVMSKDECNLFSMLDYQQVQANWKLIIKFILATDMRKHFKLLKAFDKLIRDSEFNLDNKKHKSALLSLILKCADASFLARDFEKANAASNSLIQEFFVTGNIENVTGLVYRTVGINQILDKERSLTAIINSVYLPLFLTLSSIYSNLNNTSDSVRINIKKFNEIQSQKDKEEEEIKREEEERQAREKVEAEKRELERRLQKEKELEEQENQGKGEPGKQIENPESANENNKNQDINENARQKDENKEENEFNENENNEKENKEKTENEVKIIQEINEVNKENKSNNEGENENTIDNDNKIEQENEENLENKSQINSNESHENNDEDNKEDNSSDEKEENGKLDDQNKEKTLENETQNNDENKSEENGKPNLESDQQKDEKKNIEENGTTQKENIEEKDENDKTENQSNENDKVENQSNENDKAENQSNENEKDKVEKETSEKETKDDENKPEQENIIESVNENKDDVVENSQTETQKEEEEEEEEDIDVISARDDDANFTAEDEPASDEGFEYDEDDIL